MNKIEDVILNAQHMHILNDTGLESARGAISFAQEEIKQDPNKAVEILENVFESILSNINQVEHVRDSDDNFR